MAESANRTFDPSYPSVDSIFRSDFTIDTSVGSTFRPAPATFHRRQPPIPLCQAHLASTTTAHLAQPSHLAATTTANPRRQ